MVFFKEARENTVVTPKSVGGFWCWWLCWILHHLLFFLGNRFRGLWLHLVAVWHGSWWYPPFNQKLEKWCSHLCFCYGAGAYHFLVGIGLYNWKDTGHVSCVPTPVRSLTWRGSPRGQAEKTSSIRTIRSVIADSRGKVIPYGMAVRNWLAGQSFSFQYQFGLDVLDALKWGVDNEKLL